MPSKLSAQKEQLGHPSSQSGPNMKWYTSSWLRPSNSSRSVRDPSGPSKRYASSTGTQGSDARRWAESSSRRWLSSFSRASRSSRAAVHSSRVPTPCARHGVRPR